MDVSVPVGRRRLPNPVGVASGTFGYGSEFQELVDLSRIGAVYTKAVTLDPRPGNDVPRLIETPAGLLNSIGLANVGVDVFIREKAPFFTDLPCAVIANIAGSTDDEYIEVVKRLERECDLWGYEINLSCPNVKEGCLAFGTDPSLIGSLVGQLRRITERPLIVKLTPNVTDIGSLARAAEEAGADAVSCINTLLGMVVDVAAKRPVLPGATGGLSGPAIRPVGVALTYRVSRAVSIPVVGVGGICDGTDALQYILAGASAVQVGTANFVDPRTPEKVLEAIERFLENEGLATVADAHRWMRSWP